MRTRLLSSDPALAVLQGGVFAALMTLWSMLGDHTAWREALIGGVVAAAVYGPILWLTERPERRAVAAIVSSMTAEQKRDVLRAAKTGVPPSDAALRSAAVDLVWHRIDVHDRHPVLPVVGFAAFALLSLLMAITSGWWWLAGTAIFAGMLVSAVRYPGQLARRLASLDPATSALQPGSPRVH